MAKMNVVRGNKVYKICEEHYETPSLDGPDDHDWEAIRNCPECRCMGDREDVSDKDMVAETEQDKGQYADDNDDDDDLDDRVAAAKIS